MTKRKPKLWLSYPKRRKEKSTLVLNLLLSAEKPTGKRHIQTVTITPVKSSTPKRQRIYSPMNQSPFCQLISISPSEVPYSNNESNKTINEKEHQLLDIVLEKMDVNNLKTDFVSFFELVTSDRFPLDNISLLLFLETVRFLSTTTTSEMYYSDTTKRFWKTAYRLFHGKFLYFMGGPKNYGQSTISDLGAFTADKALINFAVPNLTTIGNFDVTEAAIPKNIPPGIIEPVLDTLAASTENEYMLCADGKKVTTGINAKGGDVNMFSFEDGITFNESEEKYKEHINILNKIPTILESSEMDVKLENLGQSEKDQINCLMPDVVKVVGSRLKDCRQLAYRQRIGMEKFKGLAGEKWRESRYVFVISGLQASLFLLKEFIIEALSNIGMCLKMKSQLQNPLTEYVEDSKVDQSFQLNLLNLKETDDTSSHVEIEPQYVKQRSDTWFTLRKCARVTGSTLHSAIGLRGLKEQKKHFAKFIQNEEETISEETQRKLDHGSKNETHAIATIIGRILPSFFPNSTFIEEGCYIIDGNQTDILGVVSPDGSIGIVERNTQGQIIKVTKEYAVEIKCPFPSKNSLPVHYTLPEYYVCQCLSEMFALNTEYLLYVSYSEESTTVLRVQFDKDLWEAIWTEVKNVYDVEDLKRPTKARMQTKNLKDSIKEFVKEKVEFLCEIPSSRMNDSGLRYQIEGSPFLEPHYIEPSAKAESTIGDLVSTTSTSKQIIENGYNLLRRRASEVMVWALTNKNRNSTLEVPCTLPVAYGLKDYKLTTNAMRSATNYVIKKCADRGINVLSVSSDGQWIQMMSRDCNNYPLTMYQLAKDVWAETGKPSKQELLSKIEPFHYHDDNDPLSNVKVEKLSTGIVVVTSKDCPFSSIHTSLDKTLWLEGLKKNKQSSDDKEDNTATTKDTESNTCWIQDSVVSQMEREPDEITVTIEAISKEVMTVDFEDSQGEFTNITSTDEDDRSCNDMDTLLLHSNEENLLMTSMMSANELPEITETDKSEKDETEDRNKIYHITLDRIFLGKCLQELIADQKTGQSWNSVDEEDLKKKLESIDSISKLRHCDLNNIYNTLKEHIPKHLQLYVKSWKKEDKVNFLSGVFGLIPLDATKIRRRATKLKSPPSLRKLSAQAIRKKSYPKLVLRAAYCKHLFQIRLKAWQVSAPFSSPTIIQGTNEVIPYWFSYPEVNKSGKLIAKSLDCSHNLTHLRVRTCTTNICGLNPNAWKACAKSGETCLSVPLVEDLIDKQSVPNARTHFSVEVEQWLSEHDYEMEASFTRLVRDWYEASDTPGIPAVERVEKLLDMRSFLLQGIDFSNFPPHGRYVKGIPFVTFEGMMIDIDTKIQMHAMTASYNIRSVGSLAAETTVGILQAFYPNPQVSIKARDVPALIASTVEIMTCKANPNRGFYMRTSKSSGIYPEYEADQHGEITDILVDDYRDTTEQISVVVPLDNHFDVSDRKKSKRRIKFGNISQPQAPSRGALPVRQYHRKDESKILPTKRLGIEMEED